VWKLNGPLSFTGEPEIQGTKRKDAMTGGLGFAQPTIEALDDMIARYWS